MKTTLRSRIFCVIPLLILAMAGCSDGAPSSQPSTSSATETDVSQTVPPPSSATASETQPPAPDPAVLLYQGHASCRIVTGEGKVIYIDPYAGEGYDLAADLILITHAHSDHNGLGRVEKRNPDCRVITQAEALQEGRLQTFELGYVTVEAVEAGYNSLHSADQCVGYILTFSDGKSVYVTGDTSTTQQMPQLAEREIDYAFFCCDGVYNMGLEEAAACAEIVGAKHNIPYHLTAADTGKIFDHTLAEGFDAPNRLILEDGQEIPIE